MRTVGTPCGERARRTTLHGCSVQDSSPLAPSGARAVSTYASRPRWSSSRYVGAGAGATRTLAASGIDSAAAATAASSATYTAT